jgi:hypothetical protein
MSLDRTDRIFKLVSRHSDPKVLTVLFDHLIANQPLLGFAYGRGSIFWRGRICSSPHGYASIGDVIYPPPAETRVGRLNDNSDPVFYAATRCSTVLTEIKPADGDHVHLIGVRIKPDVSVHLMAIGELFHVYKTGFSRIAGSGPGGVVSRQLNYMGFELGTRILYVDALLADILTDPDAVMINYARTRGLRTSVFNKIDAAEGFFYPSIRDYIGTNLVVKRESFDAKFHITSSRVVRVGKRRRLGFYDITSVRHACGIEDNGAFRWLSSAEKHDRVIFGMTQAEERYCREHGDTITPDTYESFIRMAGVPEDTD